MAGGSFQRGTQPIQNEKRNGKMELKIYLRILLRHWWIVVSVFLITVAFTTLFTLSQTPVFSATGTYIVSPSSSSLDARGVLSGLDSLGGKSLVANTYVEIATSDVIRQEAADALGLPPDQTEHLVVASKLRAGSNVIEITVEGADPSLVAAYANAVGASAVSYVGKLYEVYDLKPLDPAALPAAPVKPNKALNLTMGAVLGLALGAGLAFLVAYLQTPVTNTGKGGILDHESGACNKHYFARRLQEEMSRARRQGYPLAVALMNVDANGVIQKNLSAEFQSDALHLVVTHLKQQLREEDVLSRMDDTTFGFLLPDTSKDEAKAKLEKMQASLTGTDFEIERCGVKLNLLGVSGLVSYDFNGTGQNELLAKAQRALKQAQADSQGSLPILDA